MTILSIILAYISMSIPASAAVLFFALAKHFRYSSTRSLYLFIAFLNTAVFIALFLRLIYKALS
jgi:hypothetical protein